MIQDVDFASDNFEDIIAKDPRYQPNAYAFVMNVLNYLTNESGKSCSGKQILEEFRHYAHQQYGPLVFHVMCEWGLKSCADIGEIMYNLVESKRIKRADNDNADDFAFGYDFEEEFLEPYEPEP